MPYLEFLAQSEREIQAELLFFLPKNRSENLGSLALVPIKPRVNTVSSAVKTAIPKANRGYSLNTEKAHKMKPTLIKPVTIDKASTLKVRSNRTKSSEATLI